MLGGMSRGVGTVARGLSVSDRGGDDHGTTAPDDQPTTVLERAAEKERAKGSGKGKRKDKTGSTGTTRPTRQKGRQDTVTDEPEQPEETTADDDSVRIGGRYDGAALGALALAIVVAGTSWFNVGGAVGSGIDFGLTYLVGAGALLVPLILVATAWVLMVGVESTQHSRLRLGIGTGLIVLSLLGIIHILAGQPSEVEDRASAGGIVGQFIGTPMAVGFSPYLAVPLLLLTVLYGGLQMTGMSVRDLAGALSGWLGYQVRSARHYDEDGLEGAEGADEYAAVDRELEDAVRERRTPAPVDRPPPGPVTGRPGGVPRWTTTPSIRPWGSRRPSPSRPGTRLGMRSRTRQRSVLRPPSTTTSSMTHRSPLPGARVRPRTRALRL